LNSIGFLNINKPQGMTSHDVVQRVRRLAGVKQVGHGGTLDPMADGVLPVAVGAACRLLRYLPEAKIYKAEILLGTTTTTDDTEGQITGQCSPDQIPDEQRVRAALEHFIGELDQTPPMYSAVHHQGERLYALARKGVVVDSIPARKVLIEEIELLSYACPKITARIVCGPGTYIRSIARDLGSALGCGGCLSALTRERSGAFYICDAVTLEQLAAAREQSNSIAACLMAPEEAVLFNPDHVEFRAGDDICRRIGMGQKVEITELPDTVVQTGKESILLVGANGFLAMCKLQENRLCPEVVIHSGA
jgi:tRNA pseudouridine55 synthase